MITILNSCYALVWNMLGISVGSCMIFIIAGGLLASARSIIASLLLIPLIYLSAFLAYASTAVFILMFLVSTGHWIGIY